MSATALLWILLFGFLSLKGFSRPVWSLCAYTMTFFASPAFWWWGGGLMSITGSWNLIAAGLLALSVGVQWGTRPEFDKNSKRAFLILGLFTINTGFVHFFLADYPEHSWRYFDLAWKQAGLALLVFFAIRSKEDIRVFLLALLIGCSYIGTEVVIRGEGSIEKGRLEGIHIPGAGDTNGLSGALCMGLPIAGYFLLSASSNLVSRGIAIGSAVLILETLLRCNSRGAFLAMIGAGCWLFFATNGTARKKVVLLGFLGCVAVLMQAQNIKIWERFATTFASAEDRDGSANERIEYWKAALRMIADYPLGSGGESAFNSRRGLSYIQHIYADQFRAVHNGYLDIAAGWGVQGLAFFLLLLTLAFLLGWRAMRASRHDAESVLLGATIQAILVSQAIVALFISSLDNEWFYWCFTLLLLYSRDYSQGEDNSTPKEASEESEVST